MNKPSSSLSPIQPVLFPQTSWALVKRAALEQRDNKSGMDEFCRIYWYPLYAVARRKGLSSEDACDVVQTFFLKLLAGDTLKKTDATRGRLRTWLLTLLDRQIIDWTRASKAQKRGGAQPHFLALDALSADAAYQMDPALHLDPATFYRRNLAEALLAEALDALAQVYAASGKSEIFEALLPTLEGPMPDLTYAEEATRLGLTASALRMVAHRMRERFRRKLREKAAHAFGIAQGPALDQELREVFAGIH